MTQVRLGAGLLAALVVPSTLRGQASLAPGMELHYEASGGARQAWRVEAVESGLSLGGREGCSRVRFAPGGPRPEADVRTTCFAGDTLLGWFAEQERWRATRPLAPRDSLDVESARGTSRFLTGSLATDTVGALAIPVVETTVLTIDATGEVRRRLRERFAPSLGTATWGVFEVPDPSLPGGWRPVQEFRLVEIRPPVP